MQFSEIMALIMAALAVLSLGYTFSRGRQHDVAADAQVKSDVGYIKSRIDEMVIDQKAMAQNVGELNVRVAQCEASVKQAHKRLDEHINMHPPDHNRA